MIFLLSILILNLFSTSFAQEHFIEEFEFLWKAETVGDVKLNIYKDDMTVLEPNVTFHMIAVMQFGDWGVEASESIRVTENGNELLNNFPKDLYIK